MRSLFCLPTKVERKAFFFGLEELVVALFFSESVVDHHQTDLHRCYCNLLFVLHHFDILKVHRNSIRQKFVSNFDTAKQTFPSYMMMKFEFALVWTDYRNYHKKMSHGFSTASLNMRLFLVIFIHHVQVVGLSIKRNVCCTHTYYISNITYNLR